MRWWTSPQSYLWVFWGCSFHNRTRNHHDTNLCSAIKSTSCPPTEAQMTGRHIRFGVTSTSQQITLLLWYKHRLLFGRMENKEDLWPPVHLQPPPHAPCGAVLTSLSLSLVTEDLTLPQTMCSTLSSFNYSSPGTLCLCCLHVTCSTTRCEHVNSCWDVSCFKSSPVRIKVLTVTLKRKQGFHFSIFNASYIFNQNINLPVISATLCVCVGAGPTHSWLTWLICCNGSSALKRRWHVLWLGGGGWSFFYLKFPLELNLHKREQFANSAVSSLYCCADGHKDLWR